METTSESATVDTIGSLSALSFRDHRARITAMLAGVRFPRSRPKVVQPKPDRHYATLEAANDAAILLLDFVARSAPKDTYLSKNLVDTGSRFGYRLVFEPDGSRSSWTIGADASDFLLCPPGDSPSSRAARKSIAPLHGRFHLHPESGVLLFQGLSETHETLYRHGRLGTTIQASRDPSQGGQGTSDTPTTQPVCAMYMRENRLRIGQYEFNLAFARPPARCLSETKDMHALALERMHGRQSQLISMFPSTSRKLQGRAVAYKVIESHPYVTEYAAVDIDSGRPLLLVCYKWNQLSQEVIRKRLEIESAFNADLSDSIGGILGSWCSHGSPACVLSSRATQPRSSNHLFFFITPLYEGGWDTKVWSKVTVNVRIKFFHQTLTGLCAIHNKGMIHGQIQPQSLITTREPLLRNQNNEGVSTSKPNVTRAAFASTTELLRATHRSDRPEFESPWAAPEVWESSEESPYDQKADVFSLAVCWISTLKSLTGTGISRMDTFGHAALCETLTEIKPLLPDDVFDLLGLMTAWDPEARPTASEAMEHCAWDFLERKRAEIAAINAERNRERDRLQQIARERVGPWAWDAIARSARATRV